MVCMRRLKCALFVLFFSAAYPLFSQTVQAGTERHFNFAVGTGISDFNLDYGHGRRMEGITVWLDWRIPYIPRVLSGLGLEIEGRDLSLGRPSSLSSMRQDTGEGGPMYSWHHYRNIHPYAKYLIGLGNIDFPHTPGATYTHDTRTIYAPGAGLDYRVYRTLWVRADYEYQFWPKLFGPHSLNPHGVTVGAVYDFGRKARR